MIVIIIVNVIMCYTIYDDNAVQGRLENRRVLRLHAKPEQNDEFSIVNGHYTR